MQDWCSGSIQVFVSLVLSKTSPIKGRKVIVTTGIYKIENLINHKIYIGQSTHIEIRWQEHCRPFAKSLIGKAIQKYGKENFSFEILEEVFDLSELNNLESKYIHQFNSLSPNGYNLIFEDDQQHHQFNKYSYNTLQNIIKDIKDSNLSFKDIALKYSLDLSMIYYINRGTYHTLPNEKYPLRDIKISKNINTCIDCGIKIDAKAIRCQKCYNLYRQKNLPPREELKNLIRTTPFTKIGEHFGVSDNAVRKWCKKQNLPFKSSQIKKYSDEEWEKI